MSEPRLDLRLSLPSVSSWVAKLFVSRWWVSVF